MIEWTYEDQQQARQQGWRISIDDDLECFSIKFYPDWDNTRFSSDAEALFFVMNNAINGDLLARRALYYVLQESEPDLF